MHENERNWAERDCPSLAHTWIAYKTLVAVVPPADSELFNMV